MPDDMISTTLVVVGVVLIVYGIVREIRTRRRR